MNNDLSPLSLLAFFIPFIATLVNLALGATPPVRRSLALLASLTLVSFFAYSLEPATQQLPVSIVPGFFEANEISAYCGILFNFIYALVCVAFGDRVFQTRSAGYWLLLQLFVSLSLVCENTDLFSLLLVAALIIHIKVSQEDVYQVSRRGERYILVVFSSVLAALFTLVFFGLLRVNYHADTFTLLSQSIDTLPRYLKILSSALMMTSLGAFPLHFWVKPLFAAPARYGLAVITRLNIGFVVWCKLYPMIFSGDPILDQILTYGCGANLIYAALLLFGERKLSQIVSALYLFHVPLLILAVKTDGRSGPPDFILDFANIIVAVSGLLIILGMLRDRLGAENLDRAHGLGISYPFLGIAFLICVLSLVGFPGTLGFISSEIILHHFAESTWPVAACFIITLALNGYSSFRIFGESFYGDPEQSYRRVFQPVMREKIAIVLVLLFLFASGIGPHIATPEPILATHQEGRHESR
jgi:formate hydrogenlyase subunit 3/multisubunit Na+/H+ antiporter MnhD subunit